MWQEIRKKKLGIRFRRQCSVGPFVVDFCSYEMNLVIEVDGPIHEYQQEYDERREHYILRNGYKIVRYTNEEVLFHRDKVLEALKRIIGVYLS
ncbi:MAG: DNA (cytosine-5-)-methyltransferase [Candidatus Magasanikbacteria bacterium CG10_big_fil_rev_8_21_14_0_10_47_10]|uniref:DNA (Cytosine-5-)-methyltransferase n=1 Tax=Candidatus Magasanikbacteria bacterium CG10_big_fil_rev_8_21_14_0_10_47_10 TaxID=1974652 RepID=A0A2H0TTF4_9BACT|nr:MAG: DNA (cytosine-5-)-methyltransferase [Candidatus Magasanikbacteria bacterium CG10_big_fil_rev_8_21_14_0_10_47_10]